MGSNNVGGVGGGNNPNWSRDLAQKLDAQDGKKDGMISGSVWNGFLRSVGSKGNSVNNAITVERAEVSFNYYKSTKDKDTVDWTNSEQLYEKYDKEGSNAVQTAAEGAAESAEDAQTPSAKAPTETTTYGDRTLEVKDENGSKTYTLKGGDKEVQLQTDENGNIVAYPKSGENFKATAKRLGIQAPYDDSNPIYKEFCKLNSQALSRKGGGGWFKVGEQVKIPQSMLETLNIDDYAVDNKKEVTNYKIARDAKSISPKLEVDGSEEANKVISDAAKFAAEFANSDLLDKPQIEKENDRNNDGIDLENLSRDFGDGRSVSIVKRSDGTVSVIIDHDNKKSNWEVWYQISEGNVTATVSTDDNSIENAKVSDPDFLNNLTKVMEKIFGPGALTPKEST